MPKGVKGMARAPTGNRPYITNISFSFSCKGCDQHKQFQTEKMRDKFFYLHKKFCKCQEVKGSASFDYHNSKPIKKVY
jgi:hypothetical protein